MTRPWRLQRLGTDAVGELRRVAAVSEQDRQVIAGAAEAIGAIDLARLEQVAGQLRSFNDREAD